MSDTRNRNGSDGRQLWLPHQLNQRARADNAFCRALERHLPAKAIDELYSLDSEEKKLGPWSNWAYRWKVSNVHVARWAQTITRNWHKNGRKPTFPIGAYNVGMMQLRNDPYGKVIVIDGKAHDLDSPPAPWPQNQSRDEYMRRCGEWWDRRAEQLRAAGYRPMPVNPKLDLHCDWVVLRRLGTPPKTLAAEHTGGIDTVMKGIRKLEKILELRPYENEI